MSLSGWVCVVTGASRGIGRGIALQLSEAGATVYITGRQETTLKQTAAQVHLKLKSHLRKTAYVVVVFICDQRKKLQALLMQMLQLKCRLSSFCNVTLLIYFTFLLLSTQVEERGGNCVPVICDSTKDADIQELFERIKQEQNGRLDVLVNNAYSGVQVGSLLHSHFLVE